MGGAGGQRDHRRRNLDGGVRKGEGEVDASGQPPSHTGSHGVRRKKDI